MTDRLARQLRFLTEIDRLKTVLRRTLILDRSRYENSAEHSWHLALYALVLAEHAEAPALDLTKVVKMLLVHDVVEIDVGDTWLYDAAGQADKLERERIAADRIYGLLPEPEGSELRALWEEFEARESPEARYAAAVDRVQPILHNLLTGGHTWKEGGVRRSQVVALCGHIRGASEALWAHLEGLLDQAVARGELLDG